MPWHVVIIVFCTLILFVPIAWVAVKLYKKYKGKSKNVDMVIAIDDMVLPIED